MILEHENPRTRPWLLGCVKLTLLFPELFYFCKPASTTRRRHQPTIKTAVRRITRNSTITILDFTAVLHSYSWSLEADFLYIIFLPCVYAITMSFLLNSILVFYLLTLPRELLPIISVKFRILKISHCYRVDPCGHKPWQSLNHSYLSIPEQYERIYSGSTTFACRDFCIISWLRPALTIRA